MDTQTIGIILVVLCIVMFFYVEIKKRKTIKQLMQLLQRGDYGEYLLLLNSPFVKFAFPKYNCEYMRLNAYLFMDDHEEINRAFSQMLQMKTTKKQRVDLVAKAFNYYIEQEDHKKATELMNEIDTYEDEAMKKECRKIYDIYIKKGYQYIEEMEQQLTNATGMNKGMIEYLLSLQYENKGDQKKSEEYLHRSQKDMMSDPSFLKKKTSAQ